MSQRIKATRTGTARPPKKSWTHLFALPNPKQRPEGDNNVRTRASYRTAWVGGIVAIGYLGLVGRASHLMLLPDPQLEAKARTQFEQTVEVQGRRGNIYDRNHALLATTVDLFELHVDPFNLHRAPLVEEPKKDEEADPDKPKRKPIPYSDDPVALLAKVLAEELNMDPQVLTERLARKGRRDVRIATDLTPANLERIASRVRAVAKEQDPRLNGVLFSNTTPTRFYPGRSDGAPLLGLVGHNGSGMAGLETTLDDELRGETYKYVLWRDRKGHSITPDRITAEEGHSVVLTIDRRVQDVAERAVASAMERTGAQAAYAVVMDIPTGDILAMVSLPSQNPNDTSNIDIAQFKNHAAMDAIEPGSVFKPFVAAATLEEGIYTPSSPIDCEGGAWRVSNKTIHDDHPHGMVTLTEVIKYSSNIGSAKLAFKLGPERTLKYLRDFGFSRETGLQLPGETRGSMRTVNNIKPIELATTAYGHGVTATAVQLAAAIATLGNGGVRMKPHLVRSIEDRHGNVIDNILPTPDRQVVSADTAEKTVMMMETVTEQGGTGTRARIPGFRVAGKTGTAWKHVDGGYSSTARIGSFVGITPAEAPRIAIAVVVDTPTIGSSYGGIVAGPAFSEIGEKTLRILGIEPDPELLAEALAKKPHTEPPPPKREEPVAVLAPELTWTDDGRLRVPDLVGLSMRDALATVDGAGIALSMQGSGRVTRQHPAPGTPLPSGATLEISLQ